MVAMRSSARSPLGEVRKRIVHPVPGPWVVELTMFPPMRRSPGAVVVAAPLVALVLDPLEPAVTSRGLVWETPVYSITRTSA